MLAPSSVIRANARIALKKDFIRYIAAAAVLMLSVIFSALLTELSAEITGNIFAELISVLFSLFILFPLFLGVIRFYWRSVNGGDDSINEAFIYFSSAAEYRRAAETALRMGLRLIVIFAVCLAPAGIVRIMCSSEFYEILGTPFPDFAANLWFTHECLIAVGLILFLFVQLRYYLTPFLCVADENMTPAEAINISRMISKRTVFDYIGLFFSFSGWILLSLTAIPLIFTVPYFIMAYIVHSRFAVAQYNAAVKATYDRNSAVGC